jgi:SAM-dependent methyltransferase
MTRQNPLSSPLRSSTDNSASPPTTLLFRIAQERGLASPRRILDLGCGEGQELVPFAHEGAFAVGIDPAVRPSFSDPASPRAPRFLRGRAEELPFAPRSFDLVLCRLVLPYTRNMETLAEIGRVLAPRGTLILRIHHLRYYLRQALQAVLFLNGRSLLHALRVITVGSLFQLTGYQLTLRTRFRETHEVYQLLFTLQRQLELAGLTVAAVLGPRGTPIVLAVTKDEGKS